MTLKACRECGKDVSDQAEVCPNCGIKNPAGNAPAAARPQDKNPPAKAKGGAGKGCFIIVAIFVIIVVLISVIGSQQTPTPGPAPTTSDQGTTTPAAAALSVQDFIKSFEGGGGVLNIPTEESGNYEELCREQWTNAGQLDQDEYGYCVGQEQQGYSGLIALAHNYSDMPNAQALLDSTVSQWTKNGYRDDNEIQYVFGQQISDFKDFKWLASSPGFNESEGQQCLDQWTTENPQMQDWSEVDYCYKQSPDFKTPAASN
jgi:hypothetical protein